jgi:hypothetical protein
MKRVSGRVIREGLLQGVAALLAATGTAGLIAVSAPGRAGFAPKLAAAAVVLFAIALLAGSARAIGVTTLAMLGAAIAAFAATGQSMWIRAILIGSLWYVASELAWDAIERRSGAIRTRTLDARRAFEVSTVVTIALAIAAAGFAASSLAPTRTLLSVGVVVGGLFVGLAAATRHIGRAGPEVD